MPTIAIKVEGKVQGVFFRASAQAQARNLGISGWVQNEPSGPVLMKATGTAAALDEFARWCADGPSAAEVATVKVEALPDEAFDDFEIRH